MKLKRAGIFFLLFILTAMPLSVSAAEWVSEDFTIEQPENLYAFTAETPIDDPAWNLAGITDPTSVLKLFSEDKKEVMNAVVNFVGENGSPNILVTKKASEESWKIFNFSEISKAEQEEFVKTLSAPPENFDVTTDIIHKDKISFFSIRYDSLDSFQSMQGTEQVTEVHEQVYATIFNGYIVTFNMHVQGRDFQEDEVKILEDIAFSLKITNPITKEQAEEARKIPPEEIYKTFFILGAFIVLIAGSIIFIKIRSKKEKKFKKDMAERLSAYRRKNPNGTEISGEMRFANLTDCSNEVLRTFSIYHAYIKNITEIIVGVGLSLLLVALTIIGQSEWWMILGAVALFGYQAFKIVTASSAIEKVQRKVYGATNTRNAKYAFYDTAFRVGGVQSAMAYPYFQITDIRRYKNYFYLYYGPDNAYIVDVNGFENGDKDEFYRFIKEKMAEK